MKTKKFRVTARRIEVRWRSVTIEADSYQEAARKGAAIGGNWVDGSTISNVYVTDILPYTRKYDSSKPGLVSITTLPKKLGLGAKKIKKLAVKGLESLPPEFWAEREGDEIAEVMAEPQGKNRKPGLR